MFVVFHSALATPCRKRFLKSLLIEVEARERQFKTLTNDPEGTTSGHHLTAFFRYKVSGSTILVRVPTLDAALFATVALVVVPPEGVGRIRIATRRQRLKNERATAVSRAVNGEIANIKLAIRAGDRDERTAATDSTVKVRILLRIADITIVKFRATRGSRIGIGRGPLYRGNLPIPRIQHGGLP